MDRAIDNLTTQLQEGQLSRRQFVKLAGSLGLSLGAINTLLAACAPVAQAPVEVAEAPAAEPAGPQPLVLQPWPGSYEEIYTKYVFDPFAEANNVDISTTATVEWYNVAKIKQEVESGNPTLDLSVQLPGDVARGGTDGLFEPINLENVPNVADLFYDAKTLLPWGVGYLVYSYGIGYRPGTGEFKSWWDLWDPQYEGRLSLGAFHATYVMQTVNALLTGQMAPLDVDAVIAKLEELTPNIKKMFESDADIRNLYLNDEIDAFVFFNGRVAVQIDDGIDVKFSSPDEGALGAFDYWCVTKGTKRKDLAEQFINFALSPQPQKDIGKYLHYGPTNKTVSYADDPSYCELMPCGPEAYSKLWFEDYEYVAENQDAWIERWNEWRAG
jgi:putative spermidine/putrescine transport system substrate-binding protein